MIREALREALQDMANELGRLKPLGEVVIFAALMATILLCLAL